MGLNAFSKTGDFEHYEHNVFRLVRRKYLYNTWRSDNDIKQALVKIINQNPGWTWIDLK